MITEGYNGVRKKNKGRVTALVDIDVVDEYRRAFGVVQLMQCMSEKPVPGKSYHILTGGQVDLIAHLNWLFIHWKRFTKVLMSVWAIGGSDILLLEKWHDEGKIGEVEILLGDVYPVRSKMEWQKLLEMEDSGIVTSLYTGTIHSKLLLIVADDGTKIVIESSANCNMNPRVEQSCVTISEKLFDFYWVYLHDMLEEYQSRITVAAEAKELKSQFKNETRDTDTDEGLAMFGEDEMDA